MKYLGTILLILSVNLISASACSSPKPGYGWDKVDLIQKSESILLARLEGLEERGSGILYTLVPVLVLKGDTPEKIEFYGHHLMIESSNDFDGHSRERFWNERVGRSDFPCCICGPDHGFVDNELYLLFPNAFGAMKSAEAIISVDDKWLGYVREALLKVGMSKELGKSMREILGAD